MTKRSSQRNRKRSSRRDPQRGQPGFYRSKALAAGFGLVAILLLAGLFSLWRSSPEAGSTAEATPPALPTSSGRAAQVQTGPASPAPIQGSTPLTQGPQSQASQADGPLAPAITLTTLEGTLPVGPDTGQVLVLYFSFVG